MSEVVLFQECPLPGDKFYGLVTLNVEKTLNSLSLEMIELIAPQLERWSGRDDVAFVMFEGAGQKAFCAGGDIQALYHDMKEHPGGPCPYNETFFEQEYRLDYQIHTYNKPVVVWGHGIVMGGGLGILSGGSHRIGTEKTRMAMPEITIGLFPDAGATYTFSKMPEHLAYFIAWTGVNLNGADARLVGMVDHLINHELKEEFINSFEDADWSKPKQELDRLCGIFEVTSAGFPTSELQAHDADIKALISEALAAEVPPQKFAELAQAGTGNEWLDKALSTYLKGCPTTAAVTHEQFQRAKTQSLEEMFQMELVIAVQCSRHPDFVEGVRALLIDKDNSPDWREKSFSVPTSWVAEHFELPWSENPLAALGK